MTGESEKTFSPVFLCFSKILHRGNKKNVILFAFLII